MVALAHGEKFSRSFNIRKFDFNPERVSNKNNSRKNKTLLNKNVFIYYFKKMFSLRVYFLIHTFAEYKTEEEQDAPLPGIRDLDT